MHAVVRIGRRQRGRLEKLCRYIARDKAHQCPRASLPGSSTGSVATFSGEFGGSVATFTGEFDGRSTRQGPRHKKVSGVDCLEGVARTDAKVKAMLFAARDINTVTTWSSSDLTESKGLSRGGTFDDDQPLNNPFLNEDRYWFLRGATVKTGDKVRWC